MAKAYKLNIKAANKLQKIITSSLNWFIGLHQ